MSGCIEDEFVTEHILRLARRKIWIYRVYELPSRVNPHFSSTRRDALC